MPIFKCPTAVYAIMNDSRILIMAVYWVGYVQTSSGSDAAASSVRASTRVF